MLWLILIAVVVNLILTIILEFGRISQLLQISKDIDKLLNWES